MTTPFPLPRSQAGVLVRPDARRVHGARLLGVARERPAAAGAAAAAAARVQRLAIHEVAPRAVHREVPPRRSPFGFGARGSRRRTEIRDVRRVPARGEGGG